MGCNLLSSKRIQGGVKKNSFCGSSSSGTRFRKTGFFGDFNARYFQGFRRFPATDPPLLQVEGFMFSWWEYRDNYLRLYEGRPEGEHLDEKVLGVMTEVLLRGTLAERRPEFGQSKSSLVAGRKKSSEQARSKGS
jgi:hypothetical protein